MTTEDIVNIVAQAARQHAGNPQWQPFFQRIYQASKAGMMLDVMCWHDDGSARHLVQPNSLLHFCSNVYSQRGDDGIIRHIFQVLGVETGFFIEFGGWDGIYLSNCRALALRGWSGCYIEGDARKAQELQNNYRSRPDVLCVHDWVLPTPGPSGKTIDQIAQERFPGRHVDFMVIDIDGLDYKIFEEMQIRPAVVCVEGGYAWHPRMTRRLPDEIAAQNLQQPVAVVMEIGRKKGYTPICFNQNVYFVVKELADRFAGIQNDAETLWRDAWFNESQLFRENLLRTRMGQNIRSVEGPEFATLEFDRPGLGMLGGT